MTSLVIDKIQIGDHLLIHTGLVDTVEKFHDLQNLFDQIEAPKSVVQLQNQSTEWGFVAFLHDQLYQSSIYHLSFPIAPLFSNTPYQEFISVELKNLELLPRLFNSEAWVGYSQLYDQHLLEVEKSFQPEAVDEYSLEAQFEFFHKEVNSHLLHISMNQLNEGLGRRSETIAYSQLVDVEKAIFRARSELHGQLNSIDKILAEVVSIISVIEEEHLELDGIYQTTRLFHSLLQSEILTDNFERKISWVQAQMIHEFFNRSLGVVSVVIGTNQQVRSTFTFAIRKAVHQMAEVLGESDARELMLTYRLHPAFHEFQLRVLENIPHHSAFWKMGEFVNRDLMDFIPLELIERKQRS